MTNSDADALRLLLAQSPPTAHDIEHFAYFPTSQARAEFIYRCLQAGFRLRNTSEPPEPGAGFGAIVFHKDVASEEILEQVSTMLKAFAAENGGRYDGYERRA
jgi:hypothetical protein